MLLIRGESILSIYVRTYIADSIITDYRTLLVLALYALVNCVQRVLVCTAYRAETSYSQIVVHSIMYVYAQDQLAHYHAS